MTDRALQGASLEATVGQLTTGRSRSAATARAVSSTLPPPAPTIVRALQLAGRGLDPLDLGQRAFAAEAVHRMAAARASSRLDFQVSASRPITVLPAMISTGPSSPRAAISRPSAAVAPLPCVYRLGEEKTESMVRSFRSSVVRSGRPTHADDGTGRPRRTLAPFFGKR